MTLFEKIQALQENYAAGLYADDEYEQLLLEHAIGAYAARRSVVVEGLKVDHPPTPAV